MSRTDKTRPFWVKMLDSPSNYHEVHNHGKRMLLDENGKIVHVPTGEFYPNGYEKLRTVYVNHPECDLPASPWDRDDRPYTYNACHYDHTSAWVNSGEARCGCRFCSQDDWFQQQNRRDRRKSKKYCDGGWRKEWE